MLVFTRKRNEAIMIGDGVEVRVLRVGRDGVRLGVTAPTTVAVHRREIYDQICAENRTAAEAATAGVQLLQRLRKLAPATESAPAVPASAGAANQPAQASAGGRAPR